MKVCINEFGELVECEDGYVVLECKGDEEVTKINRDEVEKAIENPEDLEKLIERSLSIVCNILKKVLR